MSVSTRNAPTMATDTPVTTSTLELRPGEWFFGPPHMLLFSQNRGILLQTGSSDTGISLATTPSTDCPIGVTYLSGTGFVLQFSHPFAAEATFRHGRLLNHAPVAEIRVGGGNSERVVAQRTLIARLARHGVVIPYCTFVWNAAQTAVASSVTMAAVFTSTRLHSPHPTGSREQELHLPTRYDYRNVLTICVGATRDIAPLRSPVVDFRASAARSSVYPTLR